MTGKEGFEQARTYMEASILMGINLANKHLREGFDKPIIVVQVPGKAAGGRGRWETVQRDSLQYEALRKSILNTFGIGHQNRDVYGTYGDWFVEAVPDALYLDTVHIRVDWDEDTPYMEQVGPVRVPKLEYWDWLVPAGTSLEKSVSIMEMFSTFYSVDSMEIHEALRAAVRLMK